MPITTSPPTDADKYAIALIRQEAPAMSFADARLLHEWRNQGSYHFTAEQHRRCEAYEDQLAKRRAEAAIPPRTNDNGGPHRRPARGRASAAGPPPELVRLDLAQYDDRADPGA